MNIFRKKTEAVILCPSCKGLGKTGYEVCVNYHKRDYDTEYRECLECDGQGRLLEVTEITRLPLEKNT